jgi:hypothetical protein
MKFIITESHVNKLIGVYTKLMNTEVYEGVCNVMVDYDNMMDKFVLNVFFDRSHILSLGDKQSSYLRKSINEIGNRFSSFTSSNPLIYQHYNNC